jgi:putative oxidoreductase
MNMNRAKQVTHVLLRIVVGFLFLQHGGQKLFGWLGGFGASPGATVPVASILGLAGVLEFAGGIAIVLGLLTRPVAFLLSGEMAWAYLTAHQPHGTWPIQNHGELAVLNSFIFLFLAANGAGGLSLDAWFHRVRAGAAGRSNEVSSQTERFPAAGSRTT